MSRDLLNRCVKQLIKHESELDNMPDNEHFALLKDIGEYLAKPLPEPAGYIKQYENGWIQFLTKPGVEGYTPLYAEPPARKPIPDVEISKAFCNETGVSIGDTIEDAFEAGVRFGEQYHGIKEQE